MKTVLTYAAAGVAIATLGACSSKPASDNMTTADTNVAAQDNAPMTGDPSGNVQRIRGTASAVSANELKIQGYDGSSSTVSLGDQTKYAWVEKAQLSDIGKGDFIGTATTGEGNAMRAVEVVIFPESMRGSGEGHYAWGTPAVLQQQGGGKSSAMTNGTVQGSSMTNGTVQGSSMTNGTVQDSSMTNGTVQGSSMTNGTVQSSSGSNGETHLTVSYNGGTANVTVPSGTPIVRFDPTDKSSLSEGQKLFVVAKPDQGNGNPAAQFVAMGKNGVMPPM